VVRWASESGALDLDLRRGGRDEYTGDNTTDQVVIGLDFIGTSPFFLFIHYKAADVVAHRSGDAGKQYREAIIENDGQLGAVMQMLTQRGLLSTTQIFVTTDHGFSGIFHVNKDLPEVAQTWLASFRRF
jgi:predicted AlkP superfamily pyrophosphatase or phosphodiesterase